MMRTIGALLPSERQKPVIHPFCEPTCPGRPNCAGSVTVHRPRISVMRSCPGNQLSVEVSAPRRRSS